MKYKVLEILTDTVVAERVETGVPRRCSVLWQSGESSKKRNKLQKEEVEEDNREEERGQMDDGRSPATLTSADESRQVAMETTLHNVHDPPLPEIRLVLLGRKGAGKSSAGRTILDGVGGWEPGKPTEECAKRWANVWGRRVTVVDTPGWEWYYPLNSTPGWVRRETLRSTTLCPPGPPRPLLLGCVTVPHLVVEATADAPCRKLLEKCGNRCHVLDTVCKGDGRAKEDGGREGGGEAEEQRHEEERAQRETIRASLYLSKSGQESREPDTGCPFPRMQRRLPELRLLLLGERETGKSSVGNAILGGAGFFRTGTVTEECICRQAVEAGSSTGRLVMVVDTPGWEAGVAGPTPERVKREMLAGMLLCPPGPHAVLLTLRVDTEVRAAPVREHLMPLGEGVWGHTLLLFTHGDQLRPGVGIEQHIRSGGQELRWLLEKCGGRYHVISSGGGGGGTGGTQRSTQVTDLLEKVEKMAAGKRCEAFSSLIQEVGDLSRWRGEEFERRLAELRAKMLRQESELRKMRETAVKSSRWFFDRRKKTKSPGKADVSEKEEGEEQEEEEDRRSLGKGGGEEEERWRWLMEDKDRELRELSAEQERTLAELHRSGQERRESALRLEQREAEVRELKQRVEEQQLNILDLQQAGQEMEQERGRQDGEVRDQWRGWATEVETFTRRIEQCECEKAALSVEVEVEEMKPRLEEAEEALEKSEKERSSSQLASERKEHSDRRELEELRRRRENKK
ncbi:hypothetical protein CRUP_038157 [Coryphaenoides rupestris]|nr:hypothetical protein CRUP_038157 [Coryphaenoides rupestris]